VPAGLRGRCGQIPAGPGRRLDQSTKRVGGGANSRPQLLAALAHSTALFVLQLLYNIDSKMTRPSSTFLFYDGVMFLLLRNAQ